MGQFPLCFHRTKLPLKTRVSHTEFIMVIKSQFKGVFQQKPYVEKYGALKDRILVIDSHICHGVNVQVW